jgi:NADH oxidase (H2O2-forming)
MNNKKKIVAIGCSGCGALAALTVKKLEPSLEVTVIRQPEERGLLTRCATPYICCGNVMVDSSYKDDSIFTEKGIKLVNAAATEIKRREKTVTAENGNIYPYDKLILATGAKPFIPPIPGVNLEGVFTLRTSGDAINILGWINSNRVRNAVLLGAGAIGIEEAYLLSRQGVRVTVIELLDHVMPNVLDLDMAEQLQDYMKKKGIVLELGQRLNEINGDKNVESVVLDSGKKINADMIIISAGARCNVKLAKDTGLELGKFGLKVNQYLQTSDSNIYAGGDLIEYENHVTKKASLGQLRPNAVIAGRAIAKNILGFNLKYPPLINSFCTKFFDKSIAGVGITETEAKKEGIETVTAKQSSISKHSMMQDKKPYFLKLVFEKKSKKVIGGQIVSDSGYPIKSIDVIGLAIRQNLKVEDLITLRCAGQPELSPDPGKEPIALAAEEAFEKFYKK